mgnify:CR=1 FL=1
MDNRNDKERNGYVQPEFDVGTRGRNYILANVNMPWVRQNETDLMLRNIDAQAGEYIADFGCGHQIISGPLADIVGNTGRVYAIDNSRQVMSGVKERANIIRVIIKDEYLPLPDSSVDAVVTLANFHHIVDKQRAFLEFSRILKHRGRLVLGDILDGTPLQKYFDGPVDRFCSTGHKHKFLNEDWIRSMCKASSLEVCSLKLEQVPWTFNNEEEAKWFLHTIHDAQCSPQECFDEAVKYLGFTNNNGKLFLNWHLFYLGAVKSQ